VSKSLRNPATGWSPGFLGPVRLAGSWSHFNQARYKRLGQSWLLYNPTGGQEYTPAPASQDVSEVVGIDKWTAAPWTKDKAIAALNLGLLFWSIQQKIQYSAATLVPASSDPSLSGMPPDQKAALVAGAEAVNSLAKEMRVPNAMMTVRNMVDALETVVLPKQFNVEVRGMLPLFRSQSNTLDCTQVGNRGSTTYEILDFGDLCKSSISTDIHAYKVASESLLAAAPDIKLSGSEFARLGAVVFTVPFIIWLIKAGVVLLGLTIVVGGVYLSLDKLGKIFKDPFENPYFLKYLETHPEAANNVGIWGMGKDIAMWIAIGASVIVGGWILVSIVSAVTRRPA